MPCKEWFDLVDQYRNAVRSYSDAVDRFRLESQSEGEGWWQRAEHARKSADRARTALLSHDRNHACCAARTAVPAGWIPEIGTEDLILGDQGQSGG